MKRGPSGLKSKLSTIGNASKREELSKAEEEAFIARRRARLVRYLQQLLSLPGLSTCLPLVSWLGAVSTAHAQAG